MFGITKTFQFKPSSFHDEESAADLALKRLSPLKEERLIDVNASVGELADDDEFDEENDEDLVHVEKVKVMVGRIQFEGIVVEEEAPKHLLCEECEHHYATAKCEICDQVFCKKCLSLTHFIESSEEKYHPHEIEGGIRALKVGDHSRIKKTHEFNLPESIFYEEDMMKLRDITQSNSLAVNKSVEFKKSKNIYSNPKWNVGEQMIFDDPATGVEAFGRIVSEWDQRHGVVGPSIIRGDDTCVMYLVDMIGFVHEHVKNYLDLIREPPIAIRGESIPDPSEINGPALSDEPLRQSRYLALDINERIYDLHEYEAYGPRYHMKKEFPPLLAANADGIDRTKARPVVPRPENEKEEIERRANACPPDSPRAAALRHYCNVIGNGKSVEDAKRGLRILVLPESALIHPRDRQNQVLIGQNKFLIEACQRHLGSKWIHMASWGFNRWRDKIEILIFWHRYRSARSVQAYVRRWLCRNEMEHQYDLWEEELYNRWKNMRLKFGFCTQDTPYAVTMDKKIFFRTHTDINRYAEFLRKCCSKCLKFLDRKRQKLLKIYIMRWKGNVDGFNEDDLKNSHFLSFAHDEILEEDQLTPRSLQLKTAQSLSDIISKVDIHNNDENSSMTGSATIKKLSEELTEEENYKSIALLPLGVATNIGQDGNYGQDGIIGDGILDPTIPPWHPSIGIKLPSLPHIYMAETAEERLNIPDKKRLLMHGFQAKHEGPTDETCWIIPGRIALGRYPQGLARKRGPTTAISALMLAGLDTFVSFMSKDEEDEIEERNNIKIPIKKNMDVSAAHASSAASLIFNDCKKIITEQTNIIKMIPTYEKTDNNYLSARRERLQAQARIDLAQKTIERTQSQLDAYPEHHEIIRIPLEPNSCPTLNEFLPIIWQLEALLRKGRNLFLYSREGHGRCGLFASVLLGRLYGLPAYETRYRIQASHDVTPIWFEQKIRVNCPQLWNQNRLMEECIDQSNRYFQGTNWRSRVDPEYYTDQLHHRERGTSQRLLSTRIEEPIQKRHLTTLQFRGHLENQGKESRDSHRTEDDRLREQGYLKPGDPPLEIQHHRDIPPAAIRRLSPKMDGEYSVDRPKPTDRALFPLLRTTNEAL